MPSFLQLPGGLPWWVTLAIVVPAALYALLFLAMPFSVFGLKSRMEAIEARLDEIQEEIRLQSLKLTEPLDSGRGTSIGASTPVPREPDLPRLSPAPPPSRREPQILRPARAEPRLDWPR